MTQPNTVKELARAIYIAWMTDERWRALHIHHPNADPNAPIAFFWAEIAAHTVLARLD